jgi:hypothetical protein
MSKAICLGYLANYRHSICCLLRTIIDTQQEHTYIVYQTIITSHATTPGYTITLDLGNTSFFCQEPHANTFAFALAFTRQQKAGQVVPPLQSNQKFIHFRQKKLKKLTRLELCTTSQNTYGITCKAVPKQEHIGKGPNLSGCYVNSQRRA